ncbi:site-specific integrase [Sphingobium sp. LB126]|uniref:site-specific integrase n=1 Tax=Sphingobium sp. LB126 TaxID=1983755 RepID=UPI0012FE54E5|nr:site-specific integrase [Sphingobium sp. LB126]
MEVESAPMLSDEEIAALVKDFYSTILAKDDHHRLMADAPDQFRAARADHYRQLAESAKEHLAENAYATVRQITSAMLARRYGLDAKFDKLSVRKVSHAMLRAGVEVAETLRARAEGDFNYEPQDKLLVEALRERPELPASVPITAAAEMPPIVAGPTFTEAAETFREEQLRRKKWERQTYLQARATYSIFCDFAGDRPLGDYVRADAGRFKALLEDLPANYSKAVEFRGLTAQQIVEQTRQQDVLRLSSRTVQRHFAALSTLWDSAIEQGAAAINIFNDWKFAAAKRARDQRQMWPIELLQALFKTPIWAGCQSEHRRSKPGTHIIRDDKFWLPLIALFSGMRQEEICQLRLDDVRKAEGIWIFDIKEGEGRQLKNRNAIRKAPIHHSLIRLGLLDYADQMRARPGNLLFPDLNPGGADNRLGHNYSKWFTRYRRDTALYVKRMDFHSFRHNAITFMKRANVPDSVVDEVTGHETAGETARYNKGLTIANLKEAVDKIDIGVDLSRLYQYT